MYYFSVMISQITPSLYLSGVEAVNQSALEHRGITLLVNACPEYPCPEYQGVKCVWVLVEDRPHAPLEQHFDSGLSRSSRTALEARWCSARPGEAGLRLLSWHISCGLRDSRCFRLISGFWQHGPSSGQTRASGDNCFSMRGNWPTATALGWWPPHRVSYLRLSSSHRTRHTALMYNYGHLELDIFL